MPTGQFPNLLDVTSRIDGAGHQMKLAQMLSQCNKLWEYLPMREANEIYGHEFSFVTSMPSGFWRVANQGVPYSKSTSAKSRVAIGLLEDWSQVDCDIADANPDGPEKFRDSEMTAFMQGMSQTMVQAYWYGNQATNAAMFDGLSTFYNTISGAQNGVNIIDGAGTGSSNLSIWLCCYSPDALFGVYPRASKAGLQIRDFGDTQRGYDAVGNPFMAYTAVYKHKMAVVPKDWRWVVRLANIDTTNAGLAGPNAADLWALLAQMVLMPPMLGNGTSGITETDAPDEQGIAVRPVFHCNRTALHWFTIQGMRNRNVFLTTSDAAGLPTTNFRGIPLALSDQLINAEARVT